MICSQALLSLFLLTGCEEGGANRDLIQQALAHEQRLPADRQSDAGRKPDQILAYFEIQPGMTVLDLFSGGGYYTELVSHITGDSGKVYAHNNQAYVDYVKDTLEQRFTEGRLSNVKRLTMELSALDLPDQSLDATLMILAMHDFYYEDQDNNWPKVDVNALLVELCSAMKPGAVLGVVDHVAEPGSGIRDVQTLHRIEPAYIRQQFSESCFEYSGESNVLRNTSDDYSKSMYAEGIRGKTDRFVYKFNRKRI